MVPLALAATSTYLWGSISVYAVATPVRSNCQLLAPLATFQLAPHYEVNQEWLLVPISASRLDFPHRFQLVKEPATIAKHWNDAGPLATTLMAVCCHSYKKEAALCFEPQPSHRKLLPIPESQIYIDIPL